MANILLCVFGMFSRNPSQSYISARDYIIEPLREQLNANVDIALFNVISKATDTASGTHLWKYYTNLSSNISDHMDANIHKTCLRLHCNFRYTFEKRNTHQTLNAFRQMFIEAEVGTY